MIKKCCIEIKERKKGFTLAEVLITLSVIGVIASITIPSLMANIQEKTWESQRKALAARMSQSFPQLKRLNGYGFKTDGTVDVDNASQIFITEGLSKVYKIATVCSKDNILSCGLPSQITTLSGTKTIAFPLTLEAVNNYLTQPYSDSNVKEGDRNSKENGGIIENTSVAAFETMNGESIALYYNPNCKPTSGLAVRNGQSEVCVNMIYDLNGAKSPNEVGKDIGFMTVFSAVDPIVAAPVPIYPFSSVTKPMYSKSGDDAAAYCKGQNSNSRLPDVYEGYSVFVNLNLLGTGLTDYWTGTPLKGAGENGETFDICPHGGAFYYQANNVGLNVVCVKK